MRGPDVIQRAVFTVGGLDQYVSADHPLRRVRKVFNGFLARLCHREGDRKSASFSSSERGAAIVRTYLRQRQSGDLASGYDDGHRNDKMHVTQVSV